MAFPTIQFNSTGSDTLASGAGPSVALTGNLAALNGTTTVTITDAVALGGVALDGSAALWVASAGKRWSAITNITGTSGNWTVTVATAFNTTESGKSWAIGGKRQTLSNSLRLGLDMVPGWKIDIQTDQTLTAVWAIGVTGNCTETTPITIYSSSTTRPLITTSTNSINLFKSNGSTDGFVFQHLRMTNTAGTKGTYAGNTGCALAAVGGNITWLQFLDCVFDGFLNAFSFDASVGFGCTRVQFISCEIKNCTDCGVRAQFNVNSGPFEMIDCWVHDNTNDGVRLFNGQGAFVALRCTFSGNTNGVSFAATGGSTNTTAVFDSCNFKGNTGIGITVGTGTAYCSFLVTNCIFSLGSGQTGLSFPSGETSATTTSPPIVYNNAWFTNAGTNIVNGPTPYADITLTGDPFVSSTDFGLNNTVGAGAACKAVGTTAPGQASDTGRNLGAVSMLAGGLFRVVNLSGTT